MTTTETAAADTPFLSRYQAYCRGIKGWSDLERLWARLAADPRPWFVYAVGEAPPQAPLDTGERDGFVRELDALLRREHDEDYCGIVYTDDLERPSLIKVYDPNNLGSVCGSGSSPPPLPGWVLSTEAPVDLNAAFPPPAARRRWWQRMFGA